MKLFVGYTHPSTVIEKGATTVPTDLKGAIVETQQKESLQFGLSHYFFGYDGKPIFSHRMAQLVSYNSDPTQRYNDLQNEFIYTPNSFLTLSTDTYFSHELGRLRSATTSATVKYGDFSGRLSNIYKDQVGTIDTNYYSVGASYAINPKVHVRSDYDYDVANSIARRKGIGISVNKGCWSYDLSYREENLLGYPQMSKIIYLQLRLIPLGGLNQKYVVGGI
jgi:LPS-assembly protein